MINNLKIKKYFTATLCMVFCSLASFAQDVSDSAIGFNAAEIRAALADRKLTPSQIEEAIKTQRKSYQIKAAQLENIRKEQTSRYFSKIEENAKKYTKRNSQSKAAFIDVPIEERNALIALYRATQEEGPWYNSRNWDTNQPVETWQGVTVVNNHVYMLNLSYSNMKGTIPDISGLKNHLVSLRLSGNKLSGSLENLGKLTALTSLSIDSNLFDSTLEPIGNLINLDHFNARDNNIIGQIPSNFANLSKLTRFIIANNKLSGDASSLGINCPKLSFLDLSSNNFTNTAIPNSFQNLTDLEDLNFSNSGLTQGLEVLGNLRKLQHLNLERNKFSGSLPQNFQNLTSLISITMRNNEINDIGALATLTTPEHIWFDQNQISSGISNFNNITNLQTLSLSFNKLTGSIPASFANMQKISSISFDYNRMGGNVPKINFIKGIYSEAFGISGNNFRFIDLKDSYAFYSTLGRSYSYTPQSDTDTVLTLSKTQGETITLEMCTDNRYLQEDIFQWFKDDKMIPGAESRTFTINSFNSTNDKGVYTCMSANAAIPNFTLARNKIFLNGANCSEVQGEIITPGHTKLHVNQISNFSFQTTATNLKYDWKIYSIDNELLDQSKEQSFATILEKNNCKIELIITDANGCKTSFTKVLQLELGCTIGNNHSGYVVPLNYEAVCIGDTVTYTYHKNTPEVPLTYKWFLYNKNLDLLRTGEGPEFTVTYNEMDSPILKVFLTDQYGCSDTYRTTYKLKICNSCTNTNEKSPIVKELFTNLLKGLTLKSARGETDAQINGTTPPELIALKSYLKNSTADKIYNFITTRNDNNEITSLQFSFAPEREYDVYFVNSWGIYYDPEEDHISNYYFELDISQYTGYNDLLISCGASPSKMVRTKSTKVPFENKLECDTGMSIRNVDFCPEKHCAKEPVNFAFETTTPNLNYTWTATNAQGTVVNEVTNTTGLYTFTPQLSGIYEVQLKATGAGKCETILKEKISIDDCVPYVSCTKDNVYSPEIQRLFIALLTKLGTAPDGGNINLYARKEIAALAPYTTDKKPVIYNFNSTDTALSFSFKETASEPDVTIPKNTSGAITAIDLSKYVDALTPTIVGTSYSNGASNNSDGSVKNIDFCPKELSCVSHIALVIDESGSIDTKEFNKIKKQLKLFVLKQAETNEEFGYNTHVSITGMSDQDVNKRTDLIAPTKLTMANLSLFNDWIDNLGKRYGKEGISQASDYWKSGLDVALAYKMKPNFVLMITDGAQTNDVAGLKATFQKFDNNNKTVTDPKLPHLYVVGIENGSYVDNESYTNKTLSKDLDPNYNPALGAANSLTTSPTAFLRKSLQFLLGLDSTEFPVADINKFDIGTYFGHANFDLLASDETYFSDKIAEAKFVCGDPAIKEFCDDCFSFKPEPGHEYILSAWVKEESFTQVKDYVNPIIKIAFYDYEEKEIGSLLVNANGAIIDGWQRVVKKFKIPAETITLGIQLENLSPSIPVYFDDIRIHPLQGSVKSFVYDPETFKLMSELDENNYSTFYEYDNEGGLVRVKKETAKGIKTIQETRSGSFINTDSN